jgi:protein-S-isoprenylcysteine O-methyltransferase Ste14
MAWLLHDPAAAELLGAATGVFVLGEVAATFAGRGRGERGRLSGSVAESLLLVRRRGDGITADRGTKWVTAIAARAAIFGALAIAALVPRLRAGANDWATFLLGVVLVLVGAGLRDWAIVTLGRFFRREVTIAPGQRLVRRGPYRVLRHPSYTGLIVVCAGYGLAFGSWVGVALAVLVMALGLLPRIRVEERALAGEFGPEYADYARSTARLVPGLW